MTQRYATGKAVEAGIYRRYEIASGHTVGYLVRVRITGARNESQVFQNIADARRWRRARIAALQAGESAGRRTAEKTTLAAAIERYLSEKRSDRKKSARSERYRLQEWKSGQLGQLALARITSTELARWRDGRLAEHMSSSTIRNDLSALSAIFQTARSEWGMPWLENPTLTLRKPPLAAGRERRLSAEEWAKLNYELSQSGNQWVTWFVRLAIETCARKSELLSVKWADVDLDQLSIRIRASKTDKAGAVAGRTIPITGEAYEILWAIPRPKPGRSVLPASSESISAAFDRAKRRAGLDFTMHDLRHEGLSRLTEIGLHPFELAKFSGHADMQSLKRYIQLDPTFIARKLDRLEGQTVLLTFGSTNAA